MNRAPNMRRLIRANRLLAEVGHSDMLEAMEHMKRMQRALKVIYTWAGVDGALVPKHARKLCADALSGPCQFAEQGTKDREALHGTN